jgi:hypothetical protein
LKLKQLLKSSDQSKKLDGSYLEYQIFGLIKIDIWNLINIKANLSKAFHIQPSEIDNMPMWEYELYVKKINELVEEENENQQKEMEKHNIKEYQKLANPKTLNRMTQPQTPNFNNIKTPNFNNISWK